MYIYVHVCIKENIFNLDTNPVWDKRCFKSVCTKLAVLHCRWRLVITGFQWDFYPQTQERKKPVFCFAILNQMKQKQTETQGSCVT